MKKILIIFLSLFVISACSSKTPEKTEIYKSNKPNTQAEQNPIKTNESDPLVIIAKQLKPQIDNWIKENNLNEYGRDINLGAPKKARLFDNEIGRYLTKYEYIIKTHPEMISVWAKEGKKKN